MTVDIPSRLGIFVPPVTPLSKYHQASLLEIQLSNGRYRLLTVALFTSTGKRFPFSHLVMPSGASNGFLEEVDIPERCFFEWRSTAPDLVKLTTSATSSGVKSSFLKGSGLISVLAVGVADVGLAAVEVICVCGEPKLKTESSLIHAWNSTHGPSRKSSFSFHSHDKIMIRLGRDHDLFKHSVVAPPDPFEVIDRNGIGLHSLSSLFRSPSILRLSPYGIFRLAPELPPNSFLLASLLEVTPSDGLREIQRLNSSSSFVANYSDTNVQLRFSCGGACIELRTGAASESSWILNIRTSLGSHNVRLVQLEHTSNAFRSSQMVTVSISITPVCFVTLLDPPFWITVGLRSFFTLLLHDCHGSPMLTSLSQK